MGKNRNEYIFGLEFEEIFPPDDRELNEAKKDDVCALEQLTGRGCMRKIWKKEKEKIVPKYVN